MNVSMITGKAAVPSTSVFFLPFGRNEHVFNPNFWSDMRSIFFFKKYFQESQNSGRSSLFFGKETSDQKSLVKVVRP